MLITFIAVGLLCFLKAFFTWGGDWKTQTELYEYYNNKDRTISSQLRADKFAFGYKKRIIEIYKIAPFMQWTTDIDTNQLDQNKWKKVNIYRNEMKLPSKD